MENQITGDRLKKGKYREVTATEHGESYPGKYAWCQPHGRRRCGKRQTQKEQLTHHGIYQGLPSIPPAANAEYTTGAGHYQCLSDRRGGYSWSFEDETGERQSVVADSAHILAWKDLTDINLDSPTDLTLQFTEEPKDVIVERWDISLWMKEGIEADIPESEPVKAERAKTGPG